MRIEFAARQTQLLAADTDGRRLAGVAVPYGVDGNTSAGRVTVQAGAVSLPADLRRVKLFTEHGRTTPVGFTTAADDTDQRLHLEFHVAATAAGDTALLEASEGVRDALSVELDNVVIRGGVVTAADLAAVALTSVPAYADARLTAADTPPIKETPVPEQDNTQSVPAPATELDPQPSIRAAAPAPTHGGHPTRTLAAIAQAAGDAIQRGDVSSLTAALTDIKWSDGPGAAGAPPQALGALWEGVGYTRKVVPNTTYSTDLHSMNVGGFVWNPKPTVAPYTGNKTAVPSTAAAFVFQSFPAQRLAGANDIDRAYDDLAVPGFWEAYWAAMAESYAVQSDAYALGKITTAAGTPGTATSVWDAIVQGLTAVSAYGGDPQIAIAQDLLSSIASTPASDVPFLLSSMFGSLGDLIAIAPPGTAAGTVTVWSKAAVTTKEAGSVPIRVQAVNIPNGGIDAALFGYIVTYVTQPGAVKAYTAPVLPLAAASSSKK
jgi:hypothetical protein